MQGYLNFPFQHVDASSIALGIILVEPGEWAIDHPITFAGRKLSAMERNYTKIEIEVLVIIYALQKFYHYLLGGGNICQWFLLIPNRNTLSTILYWGVIYFDGFYSSKSFILR